MKPRSRSKEGTDDIVDMLEATVNAAGESVARTPRLLKVLRDAGVVDAGGQGLYTILEGALRYLKGETELMRLRKPQIIVSELPLTVPLPQVSPVDEVPFGYCTEFLLKGEELEPETIRKRLEKKGESLIVVGDESAVRIHIHTLDPGNIIQLATKLGTLHQVSIRNMDEQHQDFLEMQKERMPTTDTAVIAVASGDGLKDVFSSLGAAAVVPGGQTMNPSTKDILQAVETTFSDNVIILPNNKNIIAYRQPGAVVDAEENQGSAHQDDSAGRGGAAGFRLRGGLQNQRGNHGKSPVLGKDYRGDPLRTRHQDKRPANQAPAAYRPAG